MSFRVGPKRALSLCRESSLTKPKALAHTRRASSAPSVVSSYTGRRWPFLLPLLQVALPLLPLLQVVAELRQKYSQVCGLCGAKLKLGSKFCGECGNKFFSRWNSEYRFVFQPPPSPINYLILLLSSLLFPFSLHAFITHHTLAVLVYSLYHLRKYSRSQLAR